MRQVVSSTIATGVFGLVLAWGALPATAAPADATEPVLLARADIPASDHATPPVLFAQSVVPLAPAVAVPTAAPSPILAQARVVTPDGSQPGVLWLIAMGAVLCRVGARVLRVS